MSKVPVDKNSKRGRKKLIPDSHLEGWRDEFGYFLERHWYLIGYELQQAITTKQISAAFSALPEPYRDRTKLFWRPYSRAGAPIEQRLTGRVYGAITKLAQLGHRIEQESISSLNTAERALQIAKGTTQQRMVERRHASRTEAHDQLKLKRIDLEQQLRTLSEHMTEIGAGFAQEELLNFILERRYKLKPLNFANAMAGLPYIAWRQSFKRCKAWKYRHAISIEYRELKLISAILRSDVRAESLVERIRLYLQRKFDRLGKAPKEAAKQLKNRWYYLEQAIQSVEKEQNPSEKVPFRIAAQYQLLFQTKTPADEILADDARLW